MTNARESPPKLFRLMVWSSGGRYKDDALSDFEDDYNSAIQKFGKRQAQVWAGAQAFKSVGHLAKEVLKRFLTDWWL